MSYPVQLFDFTSEENKSEAIKFLQDLNKTTTKAFGNTVPGEKISEFHKFKNVPKYLKTLTESTIKKITNELPTGKFRWGGSIGLYGRKNGTIIKKSKDPFYRLIIHVGPNEVYNLREANSSEEKGKKTNQNWNPVVLSYCYGLLMSPQAVQTTDVKVRMQPIREKLPQNLEPLVPKIRTRNYMRITVTVDLFVDTD